MMLQRCLNKEGQPVLMKWGTDVDLTRDGGLGLSSEAGWLSCLYVYCQEKSLHSFLGFLELEKIFLASSSQPRTWPQSTRSQRVGHNWATEDTATHPESCCCLPLLFLSTWKSWRLLSQSRFGVKGRKEPLFSLWYHSRASSREVKWQQFGGQRQGQGTSIWLKLFSSL